MIKKVLLNLYKKFLMKTMADNLGKVVEEKDKIVCYVEKNKCKKDKYHYSILCFGNAVKNNYKNLAKKLNLDKPICYIIDGINFDDNVSIYGHNNCEVIIKNCNFEYGLYVHVNGKCLIENSSIKAFLSNLSISANNLIIKNMDIKNELILSGCNLYVEIYANDKLDIINSNIGRRNENTNISIISENSINLVNSNIESDKIKCKTKKMQSDKNSVLIASDKLNLNVDDFNHLTITAPLIYYNGYTFKGDSQKLVLNQTNIILKIKRLEFLEVLKKLKDRCEELNYRKLNKIKNELDNQAVTKVLKKR